MSEINLTHWEGDEHKSKWVKLLIERVDYRIEFGNIPRVSIEAIVSDNPMSEAGQKDLALFLQEFSKPAHDIKAELYMRIPPEVKDRFP